MIDLDLKSQALLQLMGPEASKYLFNHLQAGEHPNYPNGKLMIRISVNWVKKDGANCFSRN